MSGINNDFLNVLRYICLEKTDFGSLALRSIDDPVYAHILPVLYWKLLKTGDANRISAELLSKLKLTHTGAIVSQSLKEELIRKIADRFENKSIELILLKGMAFNLNIYPADCPRMSSDLDILIKPNNRKIARMAVEEFMTKSESTDNHKFDGLYEDSYYCTKNKYFPSLDKHFYLAHPILFPVDEDVLWKNSKPHRHFKSSTIRDLCAEHHLIHLAIHSVKDQSFYTHHLLDAYYIIRSNKVDYGKAFKDAKKWNASYALYFQLKCCQSTFKLSPFFDESYAPSWLRQRLGWLVINRIQIINYVEKTVLHRIIQLVTQLILCNRLGVTCKHFVSFLKK